LFDLSFVQGHDLDAASQKRSQVFGFKDIKYAGVDGSICKAVLVA
jgi:hypothetical protein